MAAREDDRPLAIALMGPTASGKTALALDWAQRLDTEVISVDSALVYRGLDIGAAKPDTATLARIPHRLVDVHAPPLAGAPIVEPHLPVGPPVGRPDPLPEIVRDARHAVPARGRLGREQRLDLVCQRFADPLVGVHRQHPVVAGQ